MSDYELLIFDWDGTLVDSIGRIVESMHWAADSCGLARRGDAQVKCIIGLGLPEAIASLHPELVEPGLVERFRRCYSERYLTLEAQPSALFPGVAEALEMFRAQGYRLAVATGKSRHGLQRVLEGRGWLDYFDVTRCADEAASKPNPLMLEQILEHCGIPAERALMVGDSSFDLQMARYAGVDSVAVGYGAQSLATLREYGPALAIDNFVELHAWLDRRAGGQPIEVGEHVG